MRHLSAVAEDEMIAVFLRGEIDSPRFGASDHFHLHRRRLDRGIIDRPDLTDPNQNAARREVLGAYRGLGPGRYVIPRYPAGVRWFRAAATPADLKRVRYIATDFWTAVSGGSQLAADAAARIRQGIDSADVDCSTFWGVADAIAAGAVPPEMILLEVAEGGPLVVLEGHTRLTAYLLRPENLPAEIDVLVGYWSRNALRMVEHDLALAAVQRDESAASRPRSALAGMIRRRPPANCLWSPSFWLREIGPISSRWRLPATAIRPTFAAS